MFMNSQALHIHCKLWWVLTKKWSRNPPPHLSLCFREVKNNHFPATWQSSSHNHFGYTTSNGWNADGINLKRCQHINCFEIVCPLFIFRKWILTQWVYYLALVMKYFENLGKKSKQNKTTSCRSPSKNGEWTTLGCLGIHFIKSFCEKLRATKDIIIMWRHQQGDILKYSTFLKLLSR